MEIRKLPPELISLVHHIALNESGWWKKAVRRMIVAVVWMIGRPLSNQEISDALKEKFGIALDLAMVDTQVSALRSDKILIASSTDTTRVKVAESHLKQFESELKTSKLEGTQAKDQFSLLIKSYCAGLDANDIWEDFNSNFLLPMIKEVGANTYKLVSGESKVEEGEYLDKFIEKYDELHRGGLRRALVEFLSPNNSYTRSYILSNLNVYFLVEAAGIPSKMLAAIERSQKGKPKFRFFLDTNTLFSILELHDNPSDSAAVTLLDLAKSLKDQIELKFYVLPETVDETKRVITAAANQLESVGVPKNVATAITHFRSSGILMKYLNEAKKSADRISPKDYFAPYISDLKTILSANGIEVYGAPLLYMHQRQDVVDDTLEQQKHEEFKPESKRKGYEAIQHDVTLWHVVNDTRPRLLESPLDANDWVVTLDYSLLGFDRYKQRTNGSKIPVCILPVSLSQLLQFWVPRSQEVEDSILSSIQLPLLFYEFSLEDENTTLKIVQTISRFQNAEDIPVESVQAILVNGALRSRMSEDISDEEQISLVRDALIEQHAEVKLKLDQTAELVTQLESDNKTKNSKITTLANESDEVRAQLALKQRELEDSRTQSAKQENEFREHRELMRFRELAIFLPIVVGVVLIASMYFVLPRDNGRNVWYWLLGSSLFVMGWLALAKYLGTDKKLVESSPLFQMAGSLSKGIYSVLGVGFAWAFGKILDPYWEGFVKWLMDYFRS